MPKKRASRTGGPRARVRGKPGDRRIVLVDQTKLRRDASSACARIMARIEKARAEWSRFENEDAPAFDRWMAGVFGALMTRSRELDSLIGEKEALVREVDMEAFSTFAEHHIAYRRVMYRRANPPQAQAADTDRCDQGHLGGPDHNDHQEPDEVDLEMLFQDLLRGMAGINPDRMSDAAYDRMFRSFKKNFNPHGGVPPLFSTEDESPRPAQNPEQTRLKEIYRTLVRRLHPDLRADGDAGVSAIWHDVQEAYNAGDLDRLETLLALTDMKADATGDHTSLSRMRAVLNELTRDLKALQKSLRQAKKDDAWDFPRKQDHSGLEARIRRDMELSLADQEHRLQELESLIREWAQPRTERRFKPKGRRARGQNEFSF